jgi:hypothetical protein
MGALLGGCIAFGFGEQRRKFKINQAKSPVCLPVSHITHVRIIMPHPKRFQLREEFLHPRFIQMLHPGPAIGSNDPQLFLIHFQ